MDVKDANEQRNSTKIVCNGREIELDGAEDSAKILPSALVKEKWRRQQILMQGISNGSEDGIRRARRSAP